MNAVYEPLLTVTWLSTSSPLFWFRIADCSRGISSYTGAQHMCLSAVSWLSVFVVYSDATYNRRSEAAHPSVAAFVHWGWAYSVFPLALVGAASQTGPSWFAPPSAVSLHRVELSRTDNGPAPELGRAGAALPVSGSWLHPITTRVFSDCWWKLNVSCNVAS